MRCFVTPVTTEERLHSYCDHRRERMLRLMPEQGAVMLKSLAAVLGAAIIAAAITLFSAPTSDVVASPLPQPAAAAITACKLQPWPYLNCVGTEFGNPRVRLITFDRPAQ